MTRRGWRPGPVYQSPNPGIEPDYALSPDCVAGKHRACTGDAWDPVADEGTGCECDCHPFMRVTDTEVTE